ncbi:inner centromere protein A-like isoform X2 [Athalia rosae]|uniref:inner centromere protein A-like isoform X2 n=1 Tax=Athalia rosae TaxID=37344 RepID=UPI0020345CE4|nr:inner centromere protein A-like isoform X2 [Athalia rosae]
MIHKMMDGWSRETVRNTLREELISLTELTKASEAEIENSLQTNLEFLRRIVSQVRGSAAGPLLPKTPKALHKKPAQRIETIHEDESVEFEVTRTTSIASEPKDRDSDGSQRRSTRTASKKAASTIKQQQSLTLYTKSRKSSQDTNKTKRSAAKIKIESSDSEKECTIPPKQSKGRKPSVQKQHENSPQALQPEKKDGTFVLDKTYNHESRITKKKDSSSKRKHDQTRSPSPCPPNNHKNSRSRSGEPLAKKGNFIDESHVNSDINDTLESSIYEDAVGRPAPIHNSTKITDMTVTIDSKSHELAKTSNPKSRSSKSASHTKNHVPMNVTVVLENLSAQVSYPKTTEYIKSEDEEVGCTPEVKNFSKGALLQAYRAKLNKESKSTRKANALFSPYATDSVKKRVEAFEQVGLNSPKSVEINAPTRVTRTKTRAMAAAETTTNVVPPMQPVQSVAQKLARKSLAKAKKISLARQIKDSEESKENDRSSSASMKSKKLLVINEKTMQKQQLRTTPLTKSRLQQPMSVNRLHQTPMNGQTFSNHTGVMSASRGNIITNMDSFLQSAKQAQQISLAEKIEEKRRKANEEDVRRKREEALKAMAEEKKRKREEKQLKNKLAREAKEKLDMEKRLKAEKEREEKAKLAQQIQEEQRKEADRKRLLQLQRAQETEERRKQEEQLRLQRLQEQEEMERQLAEQKRREQEAAEKQHQRRLAEAKTQQQAAAEAMKIKAQYQSKVKQNTIAIQPKMVPAPSSYKLDSEPSDDDASDNESAPKHAIPAWATAQVRRNRLAMQEHIPVYEVHRYFNSKQCTPDLSKIFKGIDKRQLQRTSSAIWKTPPRYSMMYRD